MSVDRDRLGGRETNIEVRFLDKGRGGNPIGHDTTHYFKDDIGDRSTSGPYLFTAPNNLDIRYGADFNSAISIWSHPSFIDRGMSRNIKVIDIIDAPDENAGQKYYAKFIYFDHTSATVQNSSKGGGGNNIDPSVEYTVFENKISKQQIVQADKAFYTPLENLRREAKVIIAGYDIDVSNYHDYGSAAYDNNGSKMAHITNKEYKFSTLGRAFLPKDTSTTLNLTSRNNAAYDNVKDLASTKLVYCKVREDGRIYSSIDAPDNRSFAENSGPVFDRQLYFFTAVEIKPEDNSVLDSTHYIAYKAKIRAIMFLLADMGRLKYDRKEFFNALAVSRGDMKQVGDYFEELYFNLGPELGSGLSLARNIGGWQGESDKAKNTARFGIFHDAVHTEAHVPRIRYKDGAYKVHVCVRASFIYSFPAVSLPNYSGKTIILNTDAYGGHKNMIKSLSKIPGILTSYEGDIKNFKHAGGVTNLVMKDEAAGVKNLIELLKAFFARPGQAGGIEATTEVEEQFAKMRGQGASTTTTSRTSRVSETKLRLPRLEEGDSDAQKIQIVLSDKLYPISISATLTDRHDKALKECNIGLLLLAMKAKKRAFGYMINALDIIKHEEEKSKNKKTPAKKETGGNRLDKKLAPSGKNVAEFVEKHVAPPPVFRSKEEDGDQQKTKKALSKLAEVVRGEEKPGRKTELNKEDKKTILEARKKANTQRQQGVLSPSSVNRVTETLDTLEGGNAVLNYLYDEVLTQIDFRTILDELIACLSRIAGIDLSAEALCEVIIRETIRGMGVEKFFQTMSLIGLDMVGGIAGTPDSLAFGPTGDVIASTLPAGAQGPNPDLWNSAAGGASTPIPYPLTSDSNSFLDIVQDALTDISYVDSVPGEREGGPPGQMAAQVAQGAESINNLIDEIKKFIDMRTLCEKLVQAGLDLPFAALGELGLDLKGGLDLDSLEEGIRNAFPKLPEPPKFSLPRFQKIGSPESFDYWERVKEVILEVLASQLANIVNSLMRALIEKCFLEEEAPLGQQPAQLPADFGPLGTPPVNVFDKYGLPQDRDRMRQFMNRVFGSLNGKQSCSLLKGEAPPSILYRVQNIVLYEYPEYAYVLDGIDLIREFFISVGEIFDIDFCDVIEQTTTIIDNICDETTYYNQRVRDLMGQGISEQEARGIIQNRINDNLEQLKSLAGLASREPDQMLQDLMPPFDCSVGGVYGTLPPGLINAKNIILDVIYDAVTAGYYIDIKTIYNTLTRQVKEEYASGRSSEFIAGLTAAFPDEASANKANVPYNMFLEEEYTPFTELFELISQEAGGATQNLAPPAGRIYESIEMHKPNAGPAQVVMKVPAIDAGVKRLISLHLKSSLSNIEQGDLSGMDNVSPTNLLSLIEEQFEDGVGDDPGNISKALVNFLNGDLKLSFGDSTIDYKDKDVLYLNISDVSINTTYEDGTMTAQAADKQRVQRLLDRPYTDEYIAIVEKLDLFDDDGEVTL